jgi:enamine deaminase RidA (YjgF/YER057c/UK114 family)
MTADAAGRPAPLHPGVPYDYAAVAPPRAVVFTAGACPLDPDGRVVAPGDHRERPWWRWRGAG